MHLIAYVKTHHPKAFSALKHLRSFALSAMEKIATGNDKDGSSAAADPQPPFDPSAPAVPISYPLRTLEELESRAYFKSFHYPFNRAAVEPQSAAAGGLPRRPRMLVCHDMAGGYADDRYVQGGTNADAYAIWHWYMIDVFVYFSHSLVTLPPPCWVNTAHRHGVKVLGTFIMEWDEGKKLADKLLLTKDSAQMYAERLTELAVVLGFDGWLINMEVTLDPEQIPNLKEFVSHLSKTMHSSLPGSLVIWYDSVTRDGDLSWQNQLNDKNKPFFDLCDGIFVNYTWEENFPKLSADVAGDRKFDVYMGIDVFGRNTYGGGQWTTNVALDVIKKSDVSAAIFAPGWVYETKQPPDFRTAQNRWWGLVEETWGTVQNYPKVLPFYSNFDQVSTMLVVQLFLPLYLMFIFEFLFFIYFKEGSYNGGGNITFTGALGVGTEFTARLFKGDLLLRNSQVNFTYSVKVSGNSQLGLVLEFYSASQEKKSIFLAASGNTLLTMNQFSSRFTNVIMPRRVTKLKGGEPSWVIQESRINMRGHVLKEIRALCYKLMPEQSLSGEPSDYSAVLGDVKITSGEQNTKFPASNSWLVDGEYINWAPGSQGSRKLSVKIIWRLNVGSKDLFPKYNVYVDKTTSSLSENRGQEEGSAAEFLGEAFVKSFYASGVEVPEGTCIVKFIVQACGFDGAGQKLEDCPFLLLKVEGS
ncbi:Cytosolic endo-beta-N-acetylglucosaminidase 1 [Striga hermonthica]|uniref:mannosyl-glycoprotein endo-beta-N-acetylglucosaminidase n=1 Tax=Striga hermonthica TaxID=68872 RepID=A0A9N7NHA6_STRHE|nr:Cytosolic endo-beta-N-acetylglucosaminidase 1 [Striga hermonthica]